MGRDTGRVAVTGGSGRLGAHVVRALLGSCDLTVVDRAPPSGGLPYREADIRDLAAVRAALAGHGTVVHLAALDRVADAAPEDFTLTNVMGTWHVLQAAREAGVGRVVVCSSIAATGLDEYRADCPPLYLPVDEDHPRAPVHPYATSKLLVEEVAARFLRAGGMEVVCLRPVWVAFPDTLSRLVARAGNPAGGGVFDYVSPEDAAAAFRLAATAKDAGFGPYFISAADSAADQPTLEAIRLAHARPVEVRDPARYRENPRVSVLDIARARAGLGFEPTSDWRKLRRAVTDDCTVPSTR